VPSCGPANSSGTANTAGPSPSSAPSTPSTHTPGDVMSMPSFPGTSKPTLMFGADGTGALGSPSNQLVSEFMLFPTNSTLPYCTTTHRHFTPALRWQRSGVAG